MNDQYREELEVIRKTNNGFIRPQEVVEFARDPKTALHEAFEWDDSSAAESYRLMQARAIIRVCVIIEPTKSEKVKAYVSLMHDRHNEGGYRAMVEVMNDEMLKDQLLSDALKELQTFQRKYAKLRDVVMLGPIFNILDDQQKAIAG